MVEAPKQYAREQYGNKWEKVKSFRMNDEVPGVNFNNDYLGKGLSGGRKK